MGWLPVTKISAVLSDVDGTLVTGGKLLTAGTEAAVAALHAAGLPFSIISSRPPRGLTSLIAPLSLTAPIGGFNGGILVTPALAVIEQHLLAPDAARRGLEIIAEHGAQAWVFSGRDWFVRDPDGDYVQHEVRTVRFQPNVVADFGPAVGAAAKIVGVSRDFDLLARCEADAAARLGGAAAVSRSQLYYLDITHPLANKGAALLSLARLLKIPPAEFAVIGDGGNDVAMFAQAGLSIAMGNARPDVQKAADFVTGTNEEDGFAAAIERFILGGGRGDAASAGTGGRKEP